MVAAGRLASMILWGPPGTGKTSIARLLADAVGLRFVAISAVFSGVADLKKIFAEARTAAQAGQQTLLFVDEIHRFNRAQQDGFLPYVEDGTVTLVGATTENPSFELNAALLSRCQVLILRRLDHDALEELIDRAEAIEERPLPRDPRSARGADRQRRRRRALPAQPGRDLVLGRDRRSRSARPSFSDLLHRRVPVYDKDREGHYNLISALHKTIRGSDPQAALYYLARMLVAGEEPLYVLRRLTRAAVEDIGMADPQRAAAMPRRQGNVRFPRLARGRDRDRPGLPLSRDRAQIERHLHGAEGGVAEREGDRLADAADAHPQRADQAHEERRLRQGLCLRPSSRRGLFRPGLLARGDGSADLLRADRPRLRGAGEGAAGILERAAQRAATIGGDAG